MNSEVSTDTAKDEWLIYDDGSSGNGSGEVPPEEQPWRILIVDDDVDVHVVTKFSLRDVTYMGRRLNFYHAYTGKDAFNVLRDTPDIALVLLDVVMETDDAGLRLAKLIRGELANRLVRVVLRTGHAGQALEQSVIVDYDINDYRTKTDLTTQKLFTTVISSLRSYDSLLTTARSQEALAASLAKIKDLQLAIDQHALVSLTDQNGKVLYVNDKFCSVTKYSREELLGADSKMLNAHYHSKAFFEEMWKTIAAGRIWKGEFKNRAKDGSLYWVDSTIVPFVNSEGKPYQYVAIRNDITERKLAEERILLSESKMRGLLETSPMAVSIKRVADNSRMFSNQRYFDLFHTNASELGTIGCVGFFQNPDEYQSIYQRVLKGEAITNYQVGLQTAEKQAFSGLISFYPMEYEGEKAILGWYYDVTALKQG